MLTKSQFLSPKTTNQKSSIFTSKTTLLSKSNSLATKKISLHCNLTAHRHFVLIHGACHGAWCWYKVSALLKSAGHNVSALDMAASGVNPMKVEELRSFSDYFEPLMEFMDNLSEEERVILVGHNIGGIGISIAMERFTEKISAAVFAAASMPGSDFSYQTIAAKDDLLFKVLLQLLSIQSSLEKQSEGEKWAFEDVNKDIVFQLLSIFNPVYLFHLFLAELHYDHQVILDYLISKDTGASCAEYLLRSLHVACNSWNLFVTFSVHEKVKNPSSYKKRKILFDGSNVQTEVSSVISEHILSSGLEKQKKESTTQMFNEAKNCLLSLKCSVENLHRKKLFPYNPEAILRRLTKFQELCSDLNNHGIFSSGETT